MKKFALTCLLNSLLVVVSGQLGVRYNPAVQSTTDLQYFKPQGDLFVGDGIPFFRNGTYYYYWLLDSAHHKSLNGLGGHQWVLSTSTDLKNWKQYPIVLGIDEPWEKSICTGSIVYYQKRYYAFYATRLINDGKVNEQLSYAISDDGIHFTKQKPNPFYTTAPGYSQRNFRDPKVFTDAQGTFHLFVSSEKNDPAMKHEAGCLVHLSSKDLKNWTVHPPVLTGQHSVPECPDYFYWNGWYYLLYSDNSNTFYVKSKGAYGPWEEPGYQALNEDWANVVKTAAFRNNRRIAAAWIPSREDSADDHGEIFGGNSIFREIMQQPDGTLTTKFPEEMVPLAKKRVDVTIVADELSKTISGNGVEIAAPGGVGAAHCENLPTNCHIVLEAEPLGGNEEYGFYLQSNQKAEKGYRLNLSANKQAVELFDTRIEGVRGLDKKVKIDIVMKDGIVDVCIGDKRTIVTRTYEQRGSFLWFYAKHGTVNFNSVTINALN